MRKELEACIEACIYNEIGRLIESAAYPLNVPSVFESRLELIREAIVSLRAERDAAIASAKDAEVRVERYRKGLMAARDHVEIIGASEAALLVPQILELLDAVVKRAGGE